MSISDPTEPARSFSTAISGAGGAGAVTTGLILLQAAASAGYYGLMARSAGPQIRGGESAAMLRLGSAPLDCMDDRFDLLVGLDWLNVARFVDEIPLDDHSLLLVDPAAGPVPEALLRSGARMHQVPFKELAAGVPGGRLNMVALGALGGVSGLPQQALEAGLATVLGGKGEAILQASRACLALGYAQVEAPEATHATHRLPAVAAQPAPRWNISGNEACGLGALRGGVRFVAAYPITPASEMLEWLAPRLEQVGGSLLQAEDELASVNMIIGASFGGVPALTATSGPGLSLMLEGLGLAVASETPVTVVDVMRGGPSTGIPTKSEQADLDIALYGLHGDAPHLVLAPLSIGDCVFTTQWAVQLAEQLQTAAIVLSDQALGQSRAITDAPPGPALDLARRLEARPGPGYRRYALTDDGISPMTLPGTAQGMYTADGLEHNPRGTPSSRATDHRDQLAKRRDKLAAHAYGEHWGTVDGAGALCLLTWGSSSGAVAEAAARLRAAGTAVRVVALRLLQPLPRSALRQALGDAATVWVIEQNHGAQLFHYLKSQDALPADARSLARPGPLPLRPGEILTTVAQEP
jgi:2-oxoglutarate ferredoxin oxidoreductase subunit alpha